MWELSQYIKNQKVINFRYKRQEGIYMEHAVKPVSIMFSEYYFYLIGFMADDSKDFPTIFRIDRISDLKHNGERFDIPYRDKFNETEFRKRIQFMYIGKLKHVLFESTGPSIEPVLDRLPSAKVINIKENVYTVSAETYGDGVLMWLRTQGDWFTLKSFDGGGIIV